MKKRVLSSVLAVLMVISLVMVFSVGSFAEEAQGVTVALGTTYAEPGSVALVDVYLSATSLPSAHHDYLRAFQFSFTGAKVAASGHNFYASDNNAKSFVNVGNNEAGCTSDVGANLGSATQITSQGGMRIASIAFEVPADAAGEIVITVDAKILGFEEKGDSEATRVKAETVAGKIVILDAVGGVSDAKVGSGESYIVPVTNAAGSRVSSIGSMGMTGSFNVLTIPSNITSLARRSIRSATMNALVLKNAFYAEVDEIIEVADANSDNPKFTIYYHKCANGTDTTASAIEAQRDSISGDLTLKNLMDVVPVANVKGSSVSFAAGLAIDDFDYSNVYMTTEFVESGRVFTSAKTKNVYRSIEGVASVDATTAAVYGTAAVTNVSCMIGMTVNNVPSGTYAVKVTIYGTTADANGNDIIVCSDTVTMSVTVA